ncbi:MAG: tetratricopeptide repeat protein, partial [Deltaproteobacteria bacterium]|nr:tetratricopeptide repeat protein [Deltaproteobacteria bacterium]
LRAAKVHEERAGDAEVALRNIARAFVLRPEDLWLEKTMLRLAEKCGEWKVVTDALGKAGEGLEKDPARAAQLLCMAGKLLESEEWDEPGALAAFEKAMKLDRMIVEMDGEVAPLMAKMQKPGTELVATLLRMAEHRPGSLDTLHEAAEVAIEHGDAELKRSTLEMLYVRGSRMLVSGEEARGEKAAEPTTAWALEKLVESRREAGDTDGAATLLVDGAALPLEPAKLKQLRLEASDLLMERGDVNRAMSLFHESLEQDPEDRETLRKAAELCEKQGRVTELMALKLLELDLTDDADARLALRLDISNLAARLEQRGGRVESLLENLEERPGHGPSIEGLVGVLTARGQLERLADILAGQAEGIGDADGAALLWTHVARLAEKQGDVQRAIDANMRVVDLECTSEALDALARLHTSAGRSDLAAGWLERRLEVASKKELVPTLVRLGRAHIEAKRHEKAVEVLEKAFEKAPRNDEVRRLLIDVHRICGEWEPLVRVLTTAAENVKDESTILEYASEVHEICTTRLGAPEKSVGILERALEFSPGNGDLKTNLSEALVAAGKLDEAGKLIEEMIAGYGRRRSPERAGLHVSLARVSRARGDTDAALEHLETASKMDISNAGILKALADLAREKGNLDRAEHAYRTLLVNLRHREGEPGPVGPAEIQIELSRIADERGQKEKAAELRESAIESLARDDSQAAGLQKNLREHGDVELLHRALGTRLEHVKSHGRRARIHAQLSSLLEHDMNDADASFEAIIRAVETDPVYPLHHEAAQELARKLGRFDRLVESLEGLLVQARRGSDAYVRCELLLRLGEVTQHHLQDQKKAAGLYTQAEETGVREVDVWRAQVALATETGNKKEKKRLLDLLSSVGEDNADARTSALYSIAEVHFMAEDALEEGIESLKSAMEQDPHHDRAGRILERASEMHGEDARFLELWEEIARRSENASVLLGFLERQASLPDATQEQIREAAELAITLEKFDRAESLMLRAVERGDETGWAPLSLASRRVQSGDLEAAVKWLSEATPLADPDRVLEVGKKIARIATGPQGDPDLAARLYESLRASHPASRDVWEPLASIYAQLGELDRLTHLVDGTLDSLEDVSDRSTLRIMLASAMMGTDRARDAVDVLRDILDEQPGNLTAQSMLMEHLEKTGRTDDLSDLLETKLAAAFEQRDAEAVKALSLRLGRLRPPEQAIGTYRKALEISPDDVEIAEALLSALPDDHDPEDRAGLMEKLLARKKGDEAAEYALELAEIHHYLGSAERVLAVLETGFRAAPSNVQILKRLEQLYGAKGQHEALASRLLEAARHREGKKEKVEMLMRAAALYREELSNPALAASALDEALGLSPGDPRVVLELASAAREAGQILKAVEKLTDLLESGAGDWQIETLRMRSELYASAQDPEAAVEDLEEAFKLDASVAPDLEKALENLSASTGDTDAERKVMTRLADLRAAQDRRPDARELLASWTRSHPDDLAVLRQLRDFDTQDENWEGVAATCETLTDALEGKAKIDAVLDMTHAYQKLGKAKSARKKLEAVYAANQDSRDVRAALKDLYDILDLKEQLAEMLQSEADSVESEDEKVALLRQAADLLVAAGRAGQGVEVLENLARLRPDDIHVVTSLSDALADRYEHERAGKIIDAFLESFKGRKTPEYSLLLLRRSKIAGEAKDYEAQLSHIEKAFKFNRRNAEIVAEAANVAEKMGNFELALQALRNVHLADGPCSITVVDSLLRQARLMMMNGDNKGALLCARKALKEDPNSDDAANLIADLM